MFVDFVFVSFDLNIGIEIGEPIACLTVEMLMLLVGRRTVCGSSVGCKKILCQAMAPKSAVKAKGTAMKAAPAKTTAKTVKSPLTKKNLKKLSVLTLEEKIDKIKAEDILQLLFMQVLGWSCCCRCIFQSQTSGFAISTVMNQLHFRTTCVGYLSLPECGLGVCFCVFLFVLLWTFVLGICFGFWTFNACTKPNIK